MYRYDERAHTAHQLMGASCDRRRQATLVDRLPLLLGCLCALLPGGALLLLGQDAALTAVLRPIVDALSLPLTFVIFLLHPLVLAIDGRQRQRMAIGSGLTLRRDIGGETTHVGGRRGALLLGVPVQLWYRIKRVCFFGVSYFGTAWCLLLTMTLVGWIPWSDGIAAGARLALALLSALHLTGGVLASGILLFGKLAGWRNAVTRR